MINQTSLKEQTQNDIYSAMKELKISQLLRQANIRKKGIKSFDIFGTLLVVVFLKCTLFQLLNSQNKDNYYSKNTYNRFLNNESFNWLRFLSLLALRVITIFSRLTRQDRPGLFVIDDSTLHRDRNTKAELLAKTYDHVIRKYCKGYTLLTLGWTDGFSFVPVGFNMLSSAKKKNRYNEISKDIDHRSIAYKIRKESIMPKPDAVITLLKKALDVGIYGKYVLMDTWFTTAPMISRIKELGLDVIGMVKRGQQKYFYKGNGYTLSTLQKMAWKHNSDRVIGEIQVTTNRGVAVKLVFIKNRNKKNSWLCLLSSDITLDAQEVIRLYENRWSIECFFKVAKSQLQLGKEYQNINYSTAVASTTIVCTRYILLEWLRRQENDTRTLGALFRMTCEEVQDVTFEASLANLLLLLMDAAESFGEECINLIKSKVSEWINSQHRFYRVLAYLS